MTRTYARSCQHHDRPDRNAGPPTAPEHRHVEPDNTPRTGAPRARDAETPAFQSQRAPNVRPCSAPRRAASPDPPAFGPSPHAFVSTVQDSPRHRPSCARLDGETAWFVVAMRIEPSPIALVNSHRRTFGPFPPTSDAGHGPRIRHHQLGRRTTLTTHKSLTPFWKQEPALPSTFEKATTDRPERMTHRRSTAHRMAAPRTPPRSIFRRAPNHRPDFNNKQGWGGCLHQPASLSTKGTSASRGGASSETSRCWF